MTVLLGPKHCGKTEAARVLASLTGGQWFDVDSEIEAQTGRPVRALYAEGVEVFRAAECAALRGLLQKPDTAILAAGGGLIDNAPAMRLLAEAAARTVYLDIDAETAWSRIEAAARNGGGLPPFLQTADPQATHAELHERRAAAYKKAAAFSVSAAAKSPLELATDIFNLTL